MNPLSSNSEQNWLSACQALEQRGEAYCIATIVAQSGSIPRDVGAKIVISSTHQFDTLGGGKLEFDVINKAREDLITLSTSQNVSKVHIERFALAADLGQCCGGATQVMFEYMNAQLPKVVVFGAGHVCHALVSIMKELPCHLQVIDSRQDWLDSLKEQGVLTLLCDRPYEAVGQISPQSHVIVMTHEHSQDFEITRRALERQCFPFVGLIASKTKRNRFEFRLKEQLSKVELLENLTSPIGLSHIKGKLPMQVAVSISAQLMALFDKLNPPHPANRLVNKKQWDNAKSMVEEENR